MAMVKNPNDSAAVMLTSGASGRISALLSLHVLRSLWLLISAFFLMILLPFRGRRRCLPTGALSEKGGRKDERSSVATTGKVVRVPAKIVPRKTAAVYIDNEVAARRASAIKRVTEVCGSGDDETARDFSLFVTSRGDTIFTQSWTPVRAPVRGLVVLLHGLNEHSGRYNDFAKKLNADGFKVYGMDWIEKFAFQMPLLVLKSHMQQVQDGLKVLWKIRVWRHWILMPREGSLRSFYNLSFLLTQNCIEES